MPFEPRRIMNDKDERSFFNNSGSTIVRGAAVKWDTAGDDFAVLATAPATDDVAGIVMADTPTGTWGTLQGRGLAIGLSGAAVARGDRLTVAAGGKLITWTAAAGANAAVVGTAKRATTATDQLFELELAGQSVSRQG